MPASSLAAAPPTPLLGRSAELEAIAQRLTTQGVRLLTLTGHAGVGKPRLALAAGARLAPAFPDGIVLVDLTAVRDPTQVLLAMAQQLGILDTGSRPLVERLQEYLGKRELLLILDNFEQVLPLAVIARRLQDRLHLLQWEAGDLPERQQSLEAAIGWSYDLLSQPEQRLFRHLGVFVGQVSLNAIAAVLGEEDEEQILSGLASLAERSLVLPGRDEVEDDPEPSFGMLETVRADDSRVSLALGYLGAAYSGLGDHERAAALEAEALAHDDTRGDLHSASGTRFYLALILRELGDLPQAVQLVREGLQMSRLFQDRFHLSLGLEAALLLIGERADPEQRACLLGAGDAMHQALDLSSDFLERTMGRGGAPKSRQSAK